MSVLARFFSAEVPPVPVALKSGHGGARKRLTKEQRQFIIDNRGKLSAMEIANQVGCSLAHVYHVCKGHGLVTERTRFSPDVIEHLRVEWEKPDGDIAGVCKRLGISYSSARTYASGGGWARRESRGYKVAMTDQLVLVAAYRAGFPTTILAEEFDLTRQGVYNILVRHGLIPDRTDSNTLREYARKCLREFRSTKDSA